MAGEINELLDKVKLIQQQIAAGCPKDTQLKAIWEEVIDNLSEEDVNKLKNNGDQL